MLLTLLTLSHLYAKYDVSFLIFCEINLRVMKYFQLIYYDIFGEKLAQKYHITFIFNWYSKNTFELINGSSCCDPLFNLDQNNQSIQFDFFLVFLSSGITLFFLTKYNQGIRNSQTQFVS